VGQISGVGSIICGGLLRGAFFILALFFPTFKAGVHLAPGHTAWGRGLFHPVFPLAFKSYQTFLEQIPRHVYNAKLSLLASSVNRGK